jgi:hypothetical protein
MQENRTRERVRNSFRFWIPCSNVSFIVVACCSLFLAFLLQHMFDFLALHCAKCHCLGHKFVNSFAEPSRGLHGQRTVEPSFIYFYFIHPIPSNLSFARNAVACYISLSSFLTDSVKLQYPSAPLVLLIMPLNAVAISPRRCTSVTICMQREVKQLVRLHDYA